MILFIKKNACLEEFKSYTIILLSIQFPMEGVMNSSGPFPIIPASPTCSPDWVLIIFIKSFEIKGSFRG